MVRQFMSNCPKWLHNDYDYYILNSTAYLLPGGCGLGFESIRYFYLISKAYQTYKNRLIIVLKSRMCYVLYCMQ